MALKPIEQVQVDAIETTVKALKAASLSHEQISQAVSQQIQAFEGSTRYRVKLHEEAQADGQYISVIDTKADYVRARKSGEDAQALRCKVFGVQISIRVADSKSEFSNQQVADALRELADQVGSLSKEAKDAGNFDFNGKQSAEDEAEPENDSEETQAPQPAPQPEPVGDEETDHVDEQHQY